MESFPCPHQKLTDEQIKDFVCQLTTELHELKSSLNETIGELEEKVYLLKRHFCPEKFTTVQMNMGELSDMFAKAYNTNTGEVQTMKRPDEI